MNYELLKAINDLAGKSSVVDAIMIFATNYAVPVFAIVLLMMWFFGKEYMKKTVVYSALSGVLGILINVLISKIYFEPRPFVTHDDLNVLVDHARDASFPSDHTTGAIALAFAIALRNKRIGIVMMVFALITGFSRMYVGNHYPSDVVVGIVIGLLVAYTVNKLAFLVEPLANFIVAVYRALPFVPKKTI
ncbi:MAG: undecaprenyl-diphosphatase [Kurthia gibsonii]|uniref:undecaprenyl-diphosphatase n=1 Tax=Kurthia gibsonii TaxID=33946 RepID=UPI000B3EF58C|nr:undecaprenyl-diphosphatase [Kurthia gibsonii]RXH51087.1 undecaprenyl-diphosphatase [Kurthia gibsonii]